MPNRLRVLDGCTYIQQLSGRLQLRNERVYDSDSVVICTAVHPWERVSEMQFIKELGLCSRKRCQEERCHPVVASVVCQGCCTGCRWLLSLASLVGNIMTADMASGRASPDAEQGSVVGPKEAQGSPSLRGLDSSQMPTQLNEQPPPDDADSKQVCHCAFIKFTLSLPSLANSSPLYSCQNSHTHLQTYWLVTTVVPPSRSCLVSHTSQPHTCLLQNDVIEMTMGYRIQSLLSSCSRNCLDLSKCCLS